MLNLRMRTPNEIDFVDIETLPGDNLEAPRVRCMYYRSVMEAGESAKRPTSLGELSPFPPEASYHAQTHAVFGADAYRSFVRQYGEHIRPGRNCYTTALRMWACSVQPSSVAFVPSLLTQSAVTSVHELPCMTYAGGYVFTLVLDRMTGTARIKPTQLSCVPTSVFAHRECGPCRALPLVGERSFGFRDLGTVMAAGLRMDANEGSIRLRLPNDVPHKDPAVLLPFMLLPVINWRAVMAVQVVGESIQSEEGLLRVVNVEEHFERLCRYELAGEALAAWHADNPGVPALAAGVALHVIGLQAGTYFWLRQTLCASSRTSRLFWYNDVVHLVYDLTANAGAPCAIETASRRNWGEMLPGTTIFSPFDADSCSLYPVLHDAATGNFHLRRYEFDSSARDALAAECAVSEGRHASAVARGALLMADMEAARAGATKTDLRWDHTYAAAHEAYTMHAPLIGVRATELDAARVLLAASVVRRTHCDLSLTNKVRARVLARCVRVCWHGVCACAGTVRARVLTRWHPTQLVRSVLAEPRSAKLPGSPGLAIIRRNPHAGTYVNGGRCVLPALFRLPALLCVRSRGAESAVALQVLRRVPDAGGHPRRPALGLRASCGSGPARGPARVRHRGHRVVRRPARDAPEPRRGRPGAPQEPGHGPVGGVPARSVLHAWRRHARRAGELQESSVHARRLRNRQRSLHDRQRCSAPARRQRHIRAHRHPGALGRPWAACARAAHAAPRAAGPPEPRQQALLGVALVRWAWPSGAPGRAAANT